MELYRWVRGLRRFAHNAYEVIGCAEMLLARIFIFLRFLFGLYVLLALLR